MGKKNVIVVGGGLAGLASALYLARAGYQVTLFEKRQHLGGRAITHIRQGFRFNLGPHVLYRGGAALSVYRELGIPIRGGIAPVKGLALSGGSQYKLPSSLPSAATSGLLTLGAKAEAAKLLTWLRILEPGQFPTYTVQDWIDRYARRPQVRQLLRAWFRLATYSDRTEEQSAAAALQQFQIAGRGVLYVHEGWQKIVDTLHSHAVSAGVQFVTNSRVVGIDHDGVVRGVEIGELEMEVSPSTTLSVSLEEITRREQGTRIPADIVVIAIDPASVRELVGDTLGRDRFIPITASCLDLALSRLPRPKATFALGIDRPVYLSVHSTHAQLTPKGGALVHVMKYRQAPGDLRDMEIERSGKVPAGGGEAEGELESVLDEVQPGWRKVVVHRRYLPSMTVSHSLYIPQGVRPSPRSPIAGLYLAGDWVGQTGMLSDAALASARAAVKAIISDRTLSD